MTTASRSSQSQQLGVYPRYSDRRMQPARRVAAVRCYFARTVDEAWRQMVRSSAVRHGWRASNCARRSRVARTDRRRRRRRIDQAPAAAVPSAGAACCIARVRSLRRRVRGKCERWCVGRIAPAKDVVTIGLEAGTLNENANCHRVWFWT